MTGRHRLDRRELPIGRRVAQLRARRGLTQQVFADRIGRSKSWVDKIERGVRDLDRLSVIQTIAEVLAVTPQTLLTGDDKPTSSSDLAAAVERVRAALACPHAPDADNPPVPLPPAELDRRVRYAWTAYRSAHHPTVLRMIPALLGNLRQASHAETTGTADLALRVYRLTTHVLVKLGEADLAWLTADRATTTAGDDPKRTAFAAIPLTQALRALDQGQLAMTAALTAVRRLPPTPARDTSPACLALTGTLLIEAALAAASRGNGSGAHHLVNQAGQFASVLGDRPRPDSGSVGFGPTTVGLAHALVAADLGDSRQAIAIHHRATSSDAWNRLAAEHRAAHLIDITRAHLDFGDASGASRALLAADRIAPTEVRARPTGRVALTAILRAGTASADLTRLASAIGLTTIRS